MPSTATPRPTVARPLEITAFLDRAGWGAATAQGFDGDFSPRRYARLTRDGGATAILMDADANQKTPAFVAVAAILRRCGVRVPDIYAADAEHGMVLMEDFGARNVGALIGAGADMTPFLRRGAEMLARLHERFGKADAGGLPVMNTDYFVQQAEWFLDSYIPYARHRDATDSERDDFRAAWRAVLEPLEKMATSLVLRDFMPGNLMELPDGALGVLDFQDAGVGCIAYDLASLCEEVRHDGAFAHMPDIVDHYIDAGRGDVPRGDLMRACTILSAQRHTRILGNLARTSVTRGRADLLDFIPRVRRHLTHILAQPYLLPVRRWMESASAL
ncbi:MAG: phosphotransferase [Alphaproteobacteria bacterium]|nr:phosphotransferase [Alphaproteobacteria bacterium]